MQKLPVPDAIASHETYLIFSFKPARLPARHHVMSSADLISAFLRACFRESPSFACPPSGLTLSGVEVEGLIQAARYRLRSLRELRPPALSGPTWPGGVISPVMDDLHFWKSLEQPRGPFSLFPP